MDLLRHWRRRTFGAAAGAVFAPAAIVAAALAIGIGAGGVGGLRSIGQAFNGPDLPAVSAPRAPGSAGKLLSRVGRRNRPLPAPGPGTPPPPAHDGQAHWIKVAAQEDGTFTVTNGRNGFSKVYQAATPK